MDLNDILRSQGGIEAIAGQLGISEAEAQRGAAALLPSVLSGFGQRAGGADMGGLGGLGAVLESLGGGNLTRDVVSPAPTPVSKGNDILGEIFGSKEVSREVAGEASQSTGLDPALLKKMLPIVAMLVAGYLSSQSSRPGQGGGLGDLLGQVLGGMGGASGSGGLGGGLGGVLGSILGGRR
ncbi:DUF937 domain-containing protein [Parafrankia sp. BMG5.11]|uniref:DUF937 domain-containing protein n=1 Tax=Parafrankia sp. BMG5.11 TaxID=222540 RepID=UPI00103E9AEC|nr:DUF937 domain-containing protein [Parafrankia sp. BMG5.11]TCJ41314.1 DUF937 domain-containing protein [Parafrankia sp. BMG5.11]